MSSRKLKRICNEIKELNDSKDILKQSGIYFHVNEENMETLYVMLIGPDKTPYEKGFYFFKFDYPTNYPMEPPKAKYFTQGFLKATSSTSRNMLLPVRFNPNLYTDGKVCLSMLNTWSGPGWVPTNTISNVLVAIQALVLNEEPLRNEPGFEKAGITEINRYNNLISYANIKISVLEMIKNTPYDFNSFNNIMSDYFIENIDYYRNHILTKNQELLNETSLQSPAYGMSTNIDYSSLLSECDSLYEELLKKRENNILDDITSKIEEIEMK